MFRKILVPTDDSECASVAADYAANLASYYDATVRVLNVVDSRRIATGPHYDECREDAAEITTSVADRLDREDIMSNKPFVPGSIHRNSGRRDRA